MSRAYWSLVLSSEREKIERKIHRRSIRDSSNPFELPDTEFRRIFRMHKDCVHYLCQELYQALKPSNTADGLPVHIKVLTSIRLLADGGYQRGTGQDHGLAIAQTTVSKYLTQVSEAIIRILMPKWIAFPATEQARQRVSMGFCEKHGLPDILGAVDCTHVDIFPPPFPTGVQYKNRKGRTTINVQLVVDVDCRIININARYPGRVHDQFIFNNSKLKAEMKRLYDNGIGQYYLLGSKLILRGLNGDFRSGQLTAILGPSGAGKSSLLNILAGYKVTGAGGVICTNGEPRNLHQFRKLSRYIMQEDLLQPYITVLEAMTMAADLKLGTDLEKQKKAIIVEEIIQLLRLDRARNTASERLSGGERKRLSVALELLNNPPVVFLDEPTTGLDDVASSTCISLLKRVARGGRTVVCSLHTPSARLFAEFDHVYVVADGRCAYQGTAAGVVPFLNELQLPCPKTYNPADFIIEVSSGEYGPHTDRMVAAVENGRNQSWRGVAIESSYEEMEIESLNTGGVENHNFKHESSASQQFLVLLRRMLLQTVRNKYYLWMRVGLHLFLGFIVAVLFNKMGYDASKTIFNFGFCYACIIAMLYIPMMPVLLAFPDEVQLVKREYFNRWYGLKPYYAALVVSRTPATIFFSLIYLVITYPITSQPMEASRVLMFTTICILVALISESMGTVISSMLSVVNSVFLGPALSVPLMLLAVYGIGSGDDPLPIVWRLARACSFLRYGIEGLVAAIYGPPREDLICPDHVDYCEYKNVAYFVKIMGMSGVSFWADFGILILMLVAMNLAGYYLLRQRLSPNYAFRAIKVIGNFVKTKMSSIH